MKKMMMTLMAMLTIAVSATAMSFEQARNEALFLTDKMAYELNLTDEQYEACYEINLDYLMGVTGRSDVFGVYWERRNLDLSYILFDWQWNAYIAASYFYRPLYWEAGYWHFGIYARYPYRDYFYFGTPHFYVTYRGGHAWHVHGGRGYYYDRRDHFRAPRREHVGMHDRWDRGEFNRGSRSSTRVTARPEGRGRIENGGRLERGRMDRDRGVGRNESGARRPESGTRRTENGVGRTPERSNENNGVRNRQVEGHRNFGTGSGSSNTTPNRSVGTGSNNTTPNRSIGTGSSRPSSSVGSSSSRPSGIGNSSSRPSRDFGSSSSSSTSNRSYGSSSSRPSSSISRPSSSIGSHSTPSRSIGSSTPSRSIGSSAPSRSIGSSSPSRSMGSSSSTRSMGGSHSGGGRSGGGHAGGRR